MPLPTGHQTIMPYLMLKEAAKFATFAEEVFKAKMTFQRFREDGTTIMHSELMIDGSTIMFCETTEEWTTQTANLFIYVPDVDATYQKALSAGGTTVMEPADQDYGRSCGVMDPFGNTWWITSVPG